MENHNNDQRELKLSSSGNSKSDTVTLESVDDAILTNDNSGVYDIGEGSSEDSFILLDNVDDAGFPNENRLAVDCKWIERKVAALIFPKDDKTIELTELLERVIKEMHDNEQDEKYTIGLRQQYSLLNTRALLKDATTYKLETFDKHALVIFNHRVVDGEEPRVGTENDVDSLRRTFKNFGFEVKLHNDLTKDALFENLKEFSERDFTHYGCVAVAILTHGSSDGMLCARNQRYREIDVINQFINKATLVSKPKIFIIQACRGDEASSAAPVGRSRTIRNDTRRWEPYYFLPLESDLLILHSTYPDRLSHRDTRFGSWFIQTLCKKIDSLFLTHDLESIMTEVKRAVAIDMQTNDNNKQMPVMTSTLIRKLYFKKFDERALEECRGSRNEVLDETYVEKPMRRTGSRDKFLDKSSVEKSMKCRELRKKVAEAALTLKNHLKDTRFGSWFIQTLCEKIDKHMPVMASTLIRNVFCNKVEERALEECRGSRNTVLDDTYVEKSMRRTRLWDKFLDKISVEKSMKRRESKKKSRKQP